MVQQAEILLVCWSKLRWFAVSACRNQARLPVGMWTWPKSTRECCAPLKNEPNESNIHPTSTFKLNAAWWHIMLQVPVSLGDVIFDGFTHFWCIPNSWPATIEPIELMIWRNIQSMTIYLSLSIYIYSMYYSSAFMPGYASMYSRVN